jgi:hypothetical protein
MDGVASAPLIDRSKSIDDLEGVTWAPSSLKSYVAKTGFAVRRKPLAALTDEDLRVGLEQQIGLDYLVSITIDRLHGSPLLEARLYPGDLLDSLLNVPAGFWAKNPDLRHRATELAARAMSVAPTLPATWRASVLPGLEESHARFGGKLPSHEWLRPDQGRAEPRG